MDIDINLRNKVFPWHLRSWNSANVWWKGTVFFQNQQARMDDFIDSFLPGHEDQEYYADRIKKILCQLNGTFIFVMETPDIILCSVDRIRSIPLFYSCSDRHLIISDDAYYLAEHLKAPYNQEKAAELLFTSYVTGPDTLLDGIEQLQAGEFLIFSKSEGKRTVHRYFHYSHGNFFDQSEQQLIEQLDAVLMNVFTRLIETTAKRGKKIVVPLSGGLDSRLVVAFLKRLGVEDVICYSYGKNGNSEAEISKKVAKTLGYPWYFVEYTSKRWYTCYHSEEMRAYERYAGNLTSVPHGQDYLAVKVLKTEGKIPENAVFVPGHTGDMISGGHIPRNIGEIPCDVDHLITQILMRHYVTGRLDNPDTQQLEGIFRERIRRSMGNREVFDSESLADGIEYFDFNERQAKKIVNSVRIYEFFGYEWRIPLWDSELMDFFLRTPLPWRLHQRLYKKYGFEKVFKGELAPLADIPCAKFETPSSLKRIVMSYFFKKIPSLETGAKNIISRYKVMSDPMNYHSILSKKNTLRFYLGNLDLESYIHQQYLSSVEKAEFANRSPES